MENEFFVPLGINKDIWDFNRKMIFLDSFYECQLSKKEKSNLNYAILPYENRISSEQDALHFMNQLIHCFSLFLNDFHNVTFSFYL